MAYRVRVLQHPDGSLTIIHPAMNDLGRTDPDDDVWARICLDKTLMKHPEWQGLPSVDVQSDALPTDRKDRHKWRLLAGAVSVDATAPDLPNPRQAMLDAITAASSLADVKVLLARIVKGGG